MAFEGWAIVEIMGHRRIAGHVSEESIAGATVLRIDVPGKVASEPNKATQFYAGSALFSLTPTTEDEARKVANPPEYQPYQLPPYADDDDDERSIGDELAESGEA